MQFPLPAEGLVLERVEQLAGLCLLHVAFASPSACCSLCKTPSSRVHSVYWRSLDDAPCAGQRVRLRLRVRRFRCEAKTCPHRATRRTKIAGFSAFDEHVRRRWQEGCYDAKQLHQELQALRFEGTARTVQRYVSSWRKTEEQGAKLALVPPKPAPPSPREARWWLILPEEILSKEQASFVQRLVAASPRVRKAQALALEFRRMIVEQDGQALPAWLKEAEASEVPAFRSFAAGLKEDLDAVAAALSLPWSQGQTEGQVNKLKLVKRQGYGRASVELLRRRLVA